MRYKDAKQHTKQHDQIVRALLKAFERVTVRYNMEWTSKNNNKKDVTRIKVI